MLQTGVKDAKCYMNYYCTNFGRGRYDYPEAAIRAILR